MVKLKYSLNDGITSIVDLPKFQKLK